MATAILIPSESTVNTNITLESLSTNDLLENIKLLIKEIISKKSKNYQKKNLKNL